MDNRSFDELLRATFADGRFSGSEKHAIGELLASSQADDQKLAFYRHRAFALAREALASGNPAQVLDWLEDVLKTLLPKTERPVTVDAAYFSPGSDCPETIAQLFKRARQTADVCVFTITDDRISNAIIEAHKRGVVVRIITDNEKAYDLGSDVTRFQQAGIPVKVDQTQYHMHHKFALFDGGQLLTGSYNWTRGAADFNLENFVITNSRPLLAEFSRVFEKLWKQL